MQVVVQERVIDRVLSSDPPIKAPWPVRLFSHLPFLARIPARVVGMGVRPEHIHSPAAACAAIVISYRICSLGRYRCRHSG